MELQFLRHVDFLIKPLQQGPKAILVPGQLKAAYLHFHQNQICEHARQQAVHILPNCYQVMKVHLDLLAEDQKAQENQVQRPKSAFSGQALWFGIRYRDTGQGIMANFPPGRQDL